MDTLQMKHTVTEETLPWNVKVEVVPDFRNKSTSVVISGVADEWQMVEYLTELEHVIRKMTESAINKLPRVLYGKQR